MSTRIPAVILMMLVSFTGLAQYADHSAEHGGQLYHRFLLEAGTGADEHDLHLANWELDGWVGSDENRLRIDGSGKYTGGSTEHAELQLMYSRNISTFWDAQIGLRQDFRPDQISYLAVGIDGLAPYFFETKVHAFVSEQGDMSIQFRQENDLLLTQRLVLQPFLEASLFLQDVPELATGVGLAQAQIGLQLRHEFTRKIAPYASVAYERKFGDTASLAIVNGLDRDTINIMVGLRLQF